MVFYSKANLSIKSRCFTEQTLPPEAHNAIRLMVTNDEVDTFNTARLNLRRTPDDIDFAAVDKLMAESRLTATQKAQAERSLALLKTKDTQGLPKLLPLVEGIR